MAYKAEWWKTEPMDFDVLVNYVHRMDARMVYLATKDARFLSTEECLELDILEDLVPKLDGYSCIIEEDRFEEYIEQLIYLKHPEIETLVCNMKDSDREWPYTCIDSKVLFNFRQAANEVVDEYDLIESGRYMFYAK